MTLDASNNEDSCPQWHQYTMHRISMPRLRRSASRVAWVVKEAGEFGTIAMGNELPILLSLCSRCPLWQCFFLACLAVTVRDSG